MTPPRFAPVVLAIVLAAALAVPQLAAAPAQVKAEGRARELQKLIDCRKITDNAARLACYDEATAAMDQAEAKGDIVVVDREQARKVRRQAFGFTLPSMHLFERGEKPEEINNVSGVIASARQVGYGKWLITLADDGGAWLQVDTTEVPFDPKAGMPVKIRKASLGSYMMSLGNRWAIRVHRQE